jgi:hypothetical protein
MAISFWQMYVYSLQFSQSIHYFFHVQKTNFVAYDPYWNVVTFSNQTAKYFPDLAFDRLAGVVKQGRESTLWLNNEGRVQASGEGQGSELGYIIFMSAFLN